MLKINRLKKIKSNFPVLVGDKVVEKNTCNLLIDEISKSKAFDDMIMGGRSRINKGSKNFNNYIKSSNNSAKLFKLFNSKAFYKKIKVGHIEAGLRTGNIYSPFPEEMNRILLSKIASLHFAPTTLTKEN